jgi:hypothetical protein
MSEIKLTAPHHHLAVSIDESSLITIRHRRLHDELLLTSAEYEELIARAPEVRQAVNQAWDAIHAQREPDDDVLDNLCGLCGVATARPGFTACNRCA